MGTNIIQLSIVNSGQTPDREYANRSAAEDAGKADAKKLKIAIESFNATMKSGDLTPPLLVERQKETSTTTSDAPSDTVLISQDYAGEGEKNIVINLTGKDQGKYTIPVTPANIEKFSTAMKEITAVGKKILDSASPLTPVTNEQVQSGVADKIKATLGEFLGK